MGLRAFLFRASYCLAFGSVISSLVSIAASQILLGLSLAALLLSGERIQFPPIRLPLGIFFLSTALALLLSGNMQSGLPQIRKFYVFTIVLVVYSTFKSLRQLQALILAWAGVGTVSALVGFGQYLHRSQEGVALHAEAYSYVLDGRITGFASHWMTFGGEEMIVLLMLASFLFVSGGPGWKIFAWPSLLVLIGAVILGMTRCIFLLGMPVGLIYLLWQRNWRLVAALPIVAAAGMVAAPAAIHERIISVVQPHGEEDSNSHRAVCRIVGWEMVKAHPWFGLGPEQVGKQFDHYVPPTVHRPLPHGWYGHLHNIYLQYWAERGIFGLLAILWLIAKCLLDFIRHLRRDVISRGAKFVLYGAVAVTLAVLAEGFFEYNLGDSEVLASFLAVIASGYVAIRYDTGRVTPVVPQ